MLLSKILLSLVGVLPITLSSGLDFWNVPSGANPLIAGRAVASTGASTPVSIDIDGESFAAARFSGELQIESSSSISTSNDGGSTTVTGSQNSFRDGFYEIISSSTGEIKTIKPVVLEGDFSAGHPDGLTASSAVISYGLSIPATGSGTSFSGTLDISGLDNLSVSEVAKELAEELRTPSPSIEISGNSIATIPEVGSSFRINHDGLT